MRTVGVFAALLTLCCTDPDPTAAVPDAHTNSHGDSTTGGTVAEPEPSPDAVRHTPCPPETKVGEFRVELFDAYTAVQGQVSDGVDPAQVPGETRVEGDCALLQPIARFCDPGCPSGETCGDNGCVPRPQNVDIGEVVISGLSAPVAMTAAAPVFFYSHRGELPHPGFTPGAAITLQLRGGVDPLTLAVTGIEPVSALAESPRLLRTQPLTIRWSAPAGPAVARVHLELNIANHGGTPAWIQCDVPDTGTYTMDAALITALLDLGFSGYPTLSLSRRTVDSAPLTSGCVEFLAVHTTVADVEIPGLVSCSDDADCPDGETCRVDLTCG